MNTEIKHWPEQITGAAGNGTHVELSVDGQTLHTDESEPRGRKRKPVDRKEVKQCLLKETKP